MPCHADYYHVYYLRLRARDVARHSRDIHCRQRRLHTILGPKTQKRTSFFERVPHDCPEPVLESTHLLVQNWLQRNVVWFSHRLAGEVR